MLPERSMPKNKVWLGLFVDLVMVALFVCAAAAQVVSPVEIKDPAMRSLQQEYMDDLRMAGQDILSTKFEYPFYLSRKLDLDQAQQVHSDQRSLRFDIYSGRTVIAITGNYYAAYSAEKVNSDERARSTFVNVVVPVLKAVVPRFQSNKQVEGYAVEISHHIMGKVMRVSMERPENLMVFMPQKSAVRFLGVKDDDNRQAALMQGQIFLNAQPITIWLSGRGPQLAENAAQDDNSTSVLSQPDAEIASDGSSGARRPSATGVSKPKSSPPPQPRDTSEVALASLQTSNQQVVDQLVKELDPQAHFVTYAPPKFVVFRQGIYLELSLNSSLPASDAGSRYKLAAMAFDDHVAHLIRPVLAYFKDEQKFDGIGFSTTVHLSGKSGASTSEAVEFYFPLVSLRCYEKYDCTGQEALDAGTVLINGERVALDLQTAEAGSGQ
jgi:hypothetical protein